MSQTATERETHTRRKAGDGQERRPAKTSAQPTRLRTERGVTTIDESVVAKIAGMAAREVDGIARLGGKVSGAIAGVVGRVRGGEHRTAGVGVEIGERQAAVDLTAIVRYPASIPDVSEAVRQNVIDRLETLTGLEVVEVNIAITDLSHPDEEEPEESDRVV